MSKNTVELYIYDLSKGMASAYSPLLIGKRIEGIWHTSIVVYSREYFFGSGGIESCEPGKTLQGEPDEKLKLGETEVPYSIFKDYVQDLSETTFTAASYDLLKHNCNHFTEELAQFLVGKSIPKYILDLPNEVLQTPLGPLLQGFVSNLERTVVRTQEQVGSYSRVNRDPSPDFEQLNSQIEEARYNSFLLEERRKTLKEKLARKERRRTKKLKKLSQRGQSTSVEIEDFTMADTEAINGAAESQMPLEQAMAIEEEERREEEERKKQREPPIVYKDVLDVKVEFDALVGLIDGKLSGEEQQSLEELHQFMINDEGSWVLGDGFLNFIGRLLYDKELPKEVRIRTLNILALAALKDDVILLLHQDRRDHVIMNYAYEIDRQSVEEQKSLALFICNMFENLSSSEWLLYISEWTYNNQPLSNIRVTTKVAVHSLLSDDQILQERGSAIVYNLACKEVKTVVFDDVAVELTMALLQYFNSKPSEEHLFRCMKALARFAMISNQEVPQLIQMIGPDPRSFKGASERVDELISQISTKLR